MDWLTRIWRTLSSNHGRAAGIWVIVALELILLLMHITGIGER